MIGNYLFFHSKQLEKPIFLDHYLAIDNYNENQPVQISFYYITNKQNPAQISYVTIGDVQGYPIHYAGGLWDSEHLFSPHQEFTHHYLISQIVEFPSENIPFDDSQSWSFDTMEVMYTNGETDTVPIGQVIISQVISASNKDALRSYSSSGSTNGDNTTSFKVIKTLEITDIYYPFADIIGDDYLAVKIGTSDNSLKDDNPNGPKWLEENEYNSFKMANGFFLQKDIFPFQMKQGEGLRVYTQTNPSIKEVYEFPLSIQGRTVDGDEFIAKSYIGGGKCF
ncbi:hypothetical protein [Ornithinibacillus scapharcae]|uniref:hypothetical protein n=1 Tax=Ornithinibacillus scapharcae TaxID=1147159 RepID=UPI000225BAC0|nr:hypothetical protein [Ornithinibacillus scapharcae]